MTCNTTIISVKKSSIVTYKYPRHHVKLYADRLMVELDFTNVFIDRHFVLSVVDGDFFLRLMLRRMSQKVPRRVFRIYSLYISVIG